MAAVLRPLERLALRVLTKADALANRWYDQRFNPLYQSGTIVVALYLVLLVTGLWLLLFYRVGSPWESVARLTANPWTGNWVRGLHRYASDLAVAATIVHAFRMFAQSRSWGARAMAWVSGVLLLGLLLVCGWTGYVMVWDTFGQHLAREGARVLDALPVLSEPTSRAFTGEQPLPMAFFFLTLFVHIGVPLAMGVLFWLHVRRIARPRLLPSRLLMWSVVGALTATAVVWRLPMAPMADPFLLPETIQADLFFAFWIPVLQRLSPASALLTALALGGFALAIPRLTARGDAAPPVSAVDAELCVGCTQCALDCPYGAITMVERNDQRSTLVARVDPSVCVSCGICAGSCPPMGVGPPGRTGRDQVARVRELLASPGWDAGAIAVIGCEHGAGAAAAAIVAAGGVPHSIDCGGNLHTSVIELLLRGGAGGVLVLACPPRDCRHREGARWLVERVHHGREAELQARVDRARVRIAHVASGDPAGAVAVVRAFIAETKALGLPAARDEVVLDAECETAIAQGPR